MTPTAAQKRTRYQGSRGNHAAAGASQTQPKAAAPVTQITSSRKQTGTQNISIQLAFYDVFTGKLLILPDNLHVEFRVGDQTTSPIPLGKATDGYYSVTTTLPAPSPENSTCPATVEVKLSDTFQDECQTYTNPWVAFNPQAASNLALPMIPAEGFSSVSLFTYDGSQEDCMNDPQGRLSGVGLRLTAVRGPEQTSNGDLELFVDTQGNVKVRTTKSSSVYIPRHQAHTFSGTTVDGCLQIFGVTPNTLYRVEYFPPRNFVLDGKCSCSTYQYIGCNDQVSLCAVFQPCRPTRPKAIMFVCQECPDIPMKNFTFTLGNAPVTTDDAGVAPIPEIDQECAGVIPITHTGMVFTPDHIDLSTHGDPVLVVKVAEHAVAQSNMVKGRFVDDEENPYPRRKLVITFQGQQTQTVTDHEGCFYAPDGSTVYALEDEFGFATQPLLISSKSGD